MARVIQRDHYQLLLAGCVAQLIFFALPAPWSRLANPGYLALGGIMLGTLGQGWTSNRHSWFNVHLYRATGWAALATGAFWLVTPVEQFITGVPVAVLWSAFTVWSAMRLIVLMGQESRVDANVLRGALAGYLMLGLSGGLLSAVVETVQPGSFHGVDFTSQSMGGGPAGVWQLNFVRMNYFAFVSLTTTGYGDILPATPMAQMVSIGLAVAGNTYLAVVMGVLIGRFSASRTPEDN
jgi:voltage-gated potassium channel